MPPEAASDRATTGTGDAAVNASQDKDKKDKNDAPVNTMERRGVRIVDTFAEAFDMRAARVLITANTLRWAQTGAQTMTGFATSVIGCKVEAGIEADLKPEETPDGRPGVSVLLFAFDADGLSTRLLDRIGQTILTCPTTACFDGLPQAAERVNVGGQLRHFGDKFQASKALDGRRFWRIPVMDGEFLIEERFGVQKAIGGGNFLILGKDQDATLAAAEAAVEAMRKVRGVILPFPGGMVRAGSKVGARNYKKLPASTNDAYCPTLRGRPGVKSELPENVNAVLEIVVDGLDRVAIENSMRAGIDAACGPGIVQITAGNYGGKLGKHHFQLHALMATA
jgi:formylmethanofuran--tetrahydromethanopterin N-formyltransferase